MLNLDLARALFEEREREIEATLRRRRMLEPVGASTARVGTARPDVRLRRSLKRRLVSEGL